MKKALLLALATLAFHEALAEDSNNLHIERLEKLELSTASGLKLNAAIVGEGVGIEISCGSAVLKVPLAETIGLEISLTACEIRASKVNSVGQTPAVLEVVFGYGKPSDPFEKGEEVMGTVAFRFQDGKYTDRTRFDVATKAGGEYRKPVGKPEVEVIHKPERKPAWLNKP